MKRNIVLTLLLGLPLASYGHGESMLEKLRNASQRMQAAAEQAQVAAATAAQVGVEQNQPAQPDVDQTPPDSAPAPQVPILNIEGGWGRLRLSGSGGPRGTPSQSMVTLNIEGSRGETRIYGSGGGWGPFKISNAEIMVGILPPDPAPTQEASTQTDEDQNDQGLTHSPVIQAQSAEDQNDQGSVQSSVVQEPDLQGVFEKRSIRKLVTLNILDEVGFAECFAPAGGVFLELCSPNGTIVATIGSPVLESVDQNDQEQSSETPVIPAVARSAFEEDSEEAHTDGRVKRVPFTILNN